MPSHISLKEGSFSFSGVTTSPLAFLRAMASAGVGSVGLSSNSGAASPKRAAWPFTYSRSSSLTPSGGYARRFVSATFFRKVSTVLNLDRYSASGLVRASGAIPSSRRMVSPYFSFTHALSAASVI